MFLAILRISGHYFRILINVSSILLIITSFVLPQLLHHYLAPTCRCIHWVQADIKSLGESWVQVQSTVTNVAKTEEVNHYRMSCFNASEKKNEDGILGRIEK